MSKRKSGEIDRIFCELTPKTQEVITNFLKYYESKKHKKGSDTQYKTAVVDMFDFLNRKDVTEITSQDFRRVLEHYKDGKEDSQDKYRLMFVRYIYSYDIIKNQDGFDIDKRRWINFFEGKTNRKLEASKIDIISTAYEPALTFQQLENIIDFINVQCDENNIETLKLSFVCYMLYYTDCPIDDLRTRIKGSNFKDSKVSFDNQEYAIPERFKPLFNHLKTLKHDGFNSLDDMISKVGRHLGIEELKPSTIRSSRDQNKIKCSLCGVQFLNSYENWVSVNNRIICIKCSERLKKNHLISKIDCFNNIVIEHTNITDDPSLSAFIYTFDELKNKIPRKVDYKKIHDFQVYIGQLGERFIYDRERLRLAGTKYEKDVDITPASRPCEGYDILSFNENDGSKIYIEVKTEAGFGNDFYLTEHEIQAGKKFIQEGKKYIIYRVHNILADNKEDIQVDPPISDIFQSSEYIFKPYSYKVEKIK